MDICVLYGGRSGEHEVSLRSAASVVSNLDTTKYRITAIGIDKGGRWHLQERIAYLSSQDQGDSLVIEPSTQRAAIVPFDGIHVDGRRLDIDCVFPVLHGSFGEDGTIQGALELADLPFVGAGVLGSAVSMDKETAKRLWRDAGLPIVDFRSVDRTLSSTECETIASELGFPLFVKPCASGSSLGTSRVTSKRTLGAAIAEALRFDTRALLERYIEAREIECAVIGNRVPHAFTPGEIVPVGDHAYYDYDAKYIDPVGAELVATASLDTKIRNRIMRTAEAAYSAVRCTGMARVDFFLERAAGRIFLNEINTIPGFTSISMFPRMCAASGLAYSALLDKLLDLALERYAIRQTIKYSK
jgi:D-alanine-D-alanine ligase